MVLQLQHGLSIKRKVFYEGPNSAIKIQIRAFYKGQSYHCYLCQEIHHTNFQKKQEEKMKEAAEKLDRSIKTKTLVVSDLPMRLTNEKQL